jgi:hypothetical protein
MQRVSKQSSDYYIGVDFMEKSPSAKLQFIVGDIGYAFNNDIGIFYDFIGNNEFLLLLIKNLL